MDRNPPPPAAAPPALAIEPLYIGIAVAVLAVIIATIFIFKKAFGTKADTILLIGLSDAGKTQMFSKLINSKSQAITYMSLAENVYDGLLTPDNESLRLVDYPGAERLRKSLVEKWINKEGATLRNIVAVIDSTTIAKRARDVAELLYDALLESKRKVPLVVACNKQDIGTAKTPKVISDLLEKEFSLINQSRAASLVSTDGTNARAATLTDPDEPFEWALLNAPVEFVKCSALEKGDDESDESSLVDVRAAIGV